MKILKIFAWTCLVLIWATPAIIAAWYFFPIVVAVCLWLLFKFRKAEHMSKVRGPALLVLLLVFVVWLSFVFTRRSLPPSYENSSAALALRAALPGSAPPSTAMQQAQQERRLLAATIAAGRSDIAKVAGALTLNTNANLALHAWQDSNKADESGLTGAESVLSTALGGLEAELKPHDLPDKSKTPDLTDRNKLQGLAADANAALDKLQAEANAPQLTADQIRDKSNSLLNVLGPYEIGPLSRQIGAVESALRLKMNADISLRSTRAFRYDRRSDSVVAEQVTQVRLGTQTPVSLDITGLHAGAISPAREEIVVREDSGPDMQFDPSANVVQLDRTVKVLTLIQRVLEPHASYPLISDRVWIPFRGITLRWPIPLRSSAVLTVRLHEDGAVTLPLAFSIETPANDPLSAVYLPKSSFFYADAPLAPSGPAESSEREQQLVPGQGAPTVADLALGQEIRVQLLPSYLSWPVLQQYKSFLFVENAAMAILLALIALGWALITSH